MAEQPLRGLHILLIDDNEDTLDAIRVVLEFNGASVVCSQSAEGARLVLATTSLDLVISDLAMPFEDGFDFVRSLRGRSAAEGGRTPAIAFSSSSDPETRLRALDSGYQDCVGKPVDVAFLVRVVARVAEHRL
jgi:CheY-like chemotaxis protein